MEAHAVHRDWSYVTQRWTDGQRPLEYTKCRNPRECKFTSNNYKLTICILLILQTPSTLELLEDGYRIPRVWHTPTHTAQIVPRDHPQTKQPAVHTSLLNGTPATPSTNQQAQESPHLQHAELDTPPAQAVRRHKTRAPPHQPILPDHGISSHSHISIQHIAI